MHCPECGFVFEPKTGKPRSVPQNNRLFGLLKVAFDNWPEAHKFKPESREHLRKWLLVQAGHCTRTTMFLGDVAVMDALEITIAAIRATGEWPFVDVRGRSIVVSKADSTAFDKLSHKAACALFSELDAIIYGVFGMTADKLLKEAEAAA